MPTIRETILTALHTLLQTLLATALRGEVLPERVPAAGLLILRDGEPGNVPLDVEKRGGRRCVVHG
ncbi:hypothetical protein U879_13575 [Defluviimonas sp. 20V17]|uniref:Uncharacterized protein n=1 Tax=Allgaiera indica TaxID=765699 RepID=A0A1H2W200_9RHOB|nr:hypothetical protein U879_13575 [Defluviimonas sp. 20V17]SDW74575.1 hypothetical protein SAMN05444006_106140 [Allgaiera indica]